MSNRSTSLSRRLIGLAGVAALTVGGAGAVLLGAGPAFASTSVTSNPYVVGSLTSVSGVSVTPSSLTSDATAVYTVKFTATDGIAANGSIVLNNTDVTAVSGLSASIIDSTTSSASASSVTATLSSGEVTVTVPNAVNSGDQLTVLISGLTNPVDFASTAVTPSVWTSADLSAVNAPSYDIAPAASSVAYNPTISSSVSGASGVTYTVGAVKASAGVAASTTVTITTAQSPGAAPAAQFPSALSDYNVTDATTSSGTGQPTVVDNSTAGAVTLTLAHPVNGGDYLTFTINNVINPGDATTAATSETIAVSSSSNDIVASAATVFLGAGSVSGVSASIAPTTASTNATLSTTFTATDGVAASTGTIRLAPSSAGLTLSSTNTNYVVIDNTAGTTLSGTTTSVASNVATITLGLTGISAADSVTVEAFGVNAVTGTGYTVDVSTSGDAVPVASGTLVVGAASTTSLPTVELSSNASGGASNYTISGIKAAVALASDSGQISITASPTGTGFPGAVSDYTITDLTTPASSGAPYSIGTSSSAVTLTVSNAIASGDSLQIAIQNVINPTTSGGTYTLTLTNLSSGSAVAAATTPTAATTYPNGAFVQSGGQVDVIAGGEGFGIPSMTAYDQIAASDSSAVVSGSFPTAATPRAGTLIKVLGSPAIYVIGTNGEAYAFSTPTEFMSDGYSAKSIVNVPGLDSVTVGSGAAPTAAVTTPDGALVQSGSTIYVYAGGVAIGIPTMTELQTIQAASGSAVVQGTVSASSATTLTAGTLVQPIGSAGIYVSDGTSLYQFSTASQFSSDGYNGANVVPVSGLGSLTVA